jgi:hypothetical protein
MRANKRLRELHYGPGKLIGQLVGGEHQRRAPAPSGGGNGGRRLGAGACGTRGRFYMGLGASGVMKG